MHEILAPVSSRHFVLMLPFEMLMIFESIEVEKLTDDTTGFV